LGSFVIFVRNVEDLLFLDRFGGSFLFGFFELFFNLFDVIAVVDLNFNTHLVMIVVVVDKIFEWFFVGLILFGLLSHFAVEYFVLSFDFLFELFFHFGCHLLFLSKVFVHFDNRENECNYNQEHPEINHPEVS
jgi:hypothetical protein